MSRRIEVRRRLWAWDVRLRGKPRWGEAVDAVPSLLDDNPFAWVPVLAVALIAVVALPFLLLALELAAVVVVTVTVVVWRLVLRRPWIVEARYRSNGAVIGRWEVQGYARAGRVRDQVQALVDAGERPPASGPYDPDTPPPPRPMYRPVTAPDGEASPADWWPDDPSWPMSDDATD